MRNGLSMISAGTYSNNWWNYFFVWRNLFTQRAFSLLFVDRYAIRYACLA